MINMPPKKKKTTKKKMTMPKRIVQSVSNTKTASLPNLNSNASVKKSRFSNQKARQQENKKARAYPKGLIFGEKWVGKTHIGCSAFEQKGYEDDTFIYPNHCPVYVIDCNYSADMIATKDFPTAYKNGDIIVVNAYIDDDGNPITDPIKRVQSVRELIDELSQSGDGCLFIDGFDSVEKDAMVYIYRQFKIEERSVVC